MFAFGILCYSGVACVSLRGALRKYVRHCHYFQEVIELRDGDEIAVAQCAYGGEGDRSWREQLHIENRFVEFDTRIGHMSFVVLHNSGKDSSMLAL